MNEWVEKSVPDGENCNLTKQEKYFFFFFLGGGGGGGKNMLRLREQLFRVISL